MPPARTKLYQKNGDVLLIAKAYNGRCIMQWLTEVVAALPEQFAAVDPRTPIIALAMLHLSRFVHCVEAASRFMTEAEAREAFHHGTSFVGYWLRLARISLRQNRQEWFVRPKLHAFMHICRSIMTCRSNPRYYHCFADEDAMSWVKSTYGRAHALHRIRWIVRCGRLRIAATKMKVKMLNSEHLRELKLLEENLQTANHTHLRGDCLCRLHRLDAARDGGSRCFEEEDVVAREDLPISRFPMLRLTSGSTFELSQDTMEYQEGAASGAVKYEEGAAPPHQVKFEEGTTTAATAPAQAVAVIPTMSSQGEGPLPRFGSSGSLNGSFFEADSYELCMGILILVSVMVLALEMQYEGYVIGYELQYPKLIHPPEEVWHQWPVVLRWMDRTFTGLFVLDIMMRVCVLRLRFFCQTLNLLDFVVVSCSLMEDIFGDNFPVNAPFLRLLRFAKVARSLRVLKRAHILGSLHLLLKSVRASVEVLFWSLCLLAIIQCIAGMLLAQSLQSFLADPLEDPEVRQEVFRYFGTFTSTLLTMFEVLMANWAPPCRILVDNVSEWYSLGFIIYRCLVGFAVLNVVSAVFLQQTMKVAAADQEVAMQQRQISAEAYTKKLEAFFKRLDESGDGVLTWKEFSAVLGSPKLQNWMATLELESHDLVNLFNMIDDGDGEISLEDFLHGARHLHGCASSIAVAEVMATARRTETKTEALLLMLANLTGVGVDDVKKQTRRHKSPTALMMSTPIATRGQTPINHLPQTTSLSVSLGFQRFRERRRDHGRQKVASDA
ncbi:unnamed protein product [Durusdinium trenchii]|uniref:EF-hand domain-containing protein n=1 Tax=Durusdinium trenchii TaxID=1381693 RepID=A0ABP0R8N9_9DINO